MSRLLERFVNPDRKFSYALRPSDREIESRKLQLQQMLSDTQRFTGETYLSDFSTALDLLAILTSASSSNNPVPEQNSVSFGNNSITLKTIITNEDGQGKTVDCKTYTTKPRRFRNTQGVFLKTGENVTPLSPEDVRNVCTQALNIVSPSSGEQGMV